jgi:hypothetical protein
MRRAEQVAVQLQQQREPSTASIEVLDKRASQ